MKYSSANKKVVVLVSIQIALILGSVVTLTFFESQKTLLGNSINISGKNGFLIESVLLETEKYRLGEPFVGNPTLELGLLNTNILILKEGGNVGDLKILHLPLELDVFWNELRVEFLNFSSTTRQISNIKDSGGIISESDVISLENSGQHILDKSSILVYELSLYSESRSQNLIALQIIFAMINIVVHLFLIILIVKILQQELDKRSIVEKELIVTKKEKFETLGQLSANLAHDLRNPLSIIQMSLDNMQLLYNLNEKKQIQMKKIENAVYRIVHQVDHVLDFIQKKPLKLSKTNVSKIIDICLDSIILPTNVELILPKNNIEFFCDEKQFSIVFNNLILNGIQAIIHLGTIEISVEENNDVIIIQVKDSGDGIPKQNINSIFEPLFTTKQQGTGLGLASVKSIIETHGGTISATSLPTIFTITLPKINS